MVRIYDTTRSGQRTDETSLIRGTSKYFKNHLGREFLSRKWSSFTRCVRQMHLQKCFYQDRQTCYLPTLSCFRLSLLALVKTERVARIYQFTCIADSDVFECSLCYFFLISCTCNVWRSFSKYREFIYRFLFIWSLHRLWKDQINMDDFCCQDRRVYTETMKCHWSMKISSMFLEWSCDLSYFAFSNGNRAFILSNTLPTATSVSTGWRYLFVNWGYSVLVGVQ